MKRKYLILLLPILLISWLIYLYGGWEAAPDPSALPATQGVAESVRRAEIQTARARLRDIPGRLNVPSFSVAVARSGKIIWSEAVGYADIQTANPATPQTKYRLGSTSKAVTATGVARLVSQGRLNLDDSIGHRIPNFPEKRWNFTTRQLLSHTAGIGNYENFLSAHSIFTTLCNCRQFDSVTEALSVFNDFELLFQPGTDFKYSSFGTILASAVIEVASGQPFLEFMELQVFQAHGMASTVGDHSKPNIAGLATFYESSEGAFREWRALGVFPREINLSYKWAGGDGLGRVFFVRFKSYSL